ncbi:hypothetical protein EYZ11_010175 [Aspergillus tanneri]|uniref:Uncharacterized protein n=1 Tax=Aspergillus tanneri TaxID=1220188 RepID=A0A4S3JBD6_9EURO|nr:hypothetical protein EYZ11_010175 [Aspergillus tanneri]
MSVRYGTQNILACGLCRIDAIEEMSSGKAKCNNNAVLAGGPWCLEGTTLSADIREVERTPVFVGYSTFRVLDGQLFQSITLAQGHVRLPSARKPSNPPRKAKKRQGGDTKRARKACQALPAATNHGSLSHEQKQGLVRLREEGLTWNEIASRFPDHSLRPFLESTEESSQKPAILFSTEMYSMTSVKDSLVDD